MGCYNCKPTYSSENLIARLIACIERDSPSGIEPILNMLTKFEKCSQDLLLKKPLINIFSLQFTIPCYSVWIGSTNIYKHLIDKLSVSTNEIDDYFSAIGTSSLSIICEKGHIDILKHYLPVYLKSENKKKKQERSCTLSFTVGKSALEIQKTLLTPIQIACSRLYISVLHFVNEYFSIAYPPPALDIHYVEEATGENCALVSLRTGNLTLIKYLFEICSADFHIKNLSREGAFQILASASKSSCNLAYFDCAMYLADVVNVDVVYMHEETLLLLENKMIINYIEGKLKNLGISTTKAELEDSNRIKMYNREEKPEVTNLVGDTNIISNIDHMSISHFGNSLSYV